MPMSRFEPKYDELIDCLGSKNGSNVAAAIITSDTHAKEIAIAFDLGEHRVRIGGCVKGAGMISPSMATMLCFITTDANIPAENLRKTVLECVEDSFNRITIDGDMSTNDTVLVLANGASGWKLDAPLRGRGSSKPSALTSTLTSALTSTSAFASALTSLCTDLAQQIVRDGEGATKFITIRVEGAASAADARAAAKSVANSPLVKTAFYGGDANWGRILAAVGYSGATVDPGKADLWIAAGTGDGDTETRGHGDALQLVRAGQPLSYSEEAASAIFAGPEITVAIKLGLGDGQATVWTCDLSHDYVSINGHYRT
jgi:glutamate N-acetyltransferase/amino-acid N-acetyltransferase